MERMIRLGNIARDTLGKADPRQDNLL